MHDELLERRLRTTLRDEADRLPFTITAAELERRVAGRGRRTGDRRLTLLLAAAVALGAVGVGGILAGLANNPRPTAPAIVVPSNTPATTVPASSLPSLNELIALDPSDVLVASAHGPSDGPGDRVPGLDSATASEVALGDVAGGGAYRIAGACFGDQPLLVSIRAVGGSEPLDVPQIPCDGSVVLRTVQIDGPASVRFVFGAPTSWRVVIRGDVRPLPNPTADPVLPPAPDGVEELVRVDDQVVGSDAQAWPGTQLAIRDVGNVPPRLSYGARVWCEPGREMRLIFGDDGGGAVTADTETHLRCDGAVHDLRLDIPRPDGSQIYVAAGGIAHWSVLITSAQPPVALTRELPGWQLSVGYGPSLSISDLPHGVSMTAGDSGGDQVMVVLACTGTNPIEVSVDVGDAVGERVERFLADCSPEGGETSRTFEVAGDAHVTYEAPPGEWTALSVLVPAERGAP